MKGKFYGVGVGPGDPELMTLKALRLIENADIIAVPGKIPEETTAYKIAKGAYEDIDKKELVPIYMPMTKDEEALQKSHVDAALKIESYLKEGKDVVFLTLGDPTVYSTYIYIHKLILNKDYEAEMVPGIPSFCAAASAFNMSLAEKDELLHIVPASYSLKKLPEILSLPGNKVLMKSGKRMAEVKDAIRETDLSVSMAENCTMEDEKLYNSLEEIPDSAGYYSLIILKDKAPSLKNVCDKTSFEKNSKPKNESEEGKKDTALHDEAVELINSKYQLLKGNDGFAKAVDVKNAIIKDESFKKFGIDNVTCFIKEHTDSFEIKMHGPALLFKPINDREKEVLEKIHGIISDVFNDHVDIDGCVPMTIAGKYIKDFIPEEDLEIAGYQKISRFIERFPTKYAVCPDNSARYKCL